MIQVFPSSKGCVSGVNFFVFFAVSSLTAHCHVTHLAGYCPDAIAAGFTSQIYASLMSFASGQINRGALGWIAAAYAMSLFLQ
jgi:hypothetical protein